MQLCHLILNTRCIFSFERVRANNEASNEMWKIVLFPKTSCETANYHIIWLLRMWWEQMLHLQFIHAYVKRPIIFGNSNPQDQCYQIWYHRFSGSEDSLLHSTYVWIFSNEPNLVTKILDDPCYFHTRQGKLLFSQISHFSTSSKTWKHHWC